jgi:signal transduction histidine kinase
MASSLTGSAKARPGGPLWWFTGALFFPFLLVVVLLWQAARNETGRRATEARVLADYGAFAVRALVTRADSAIHADASSAFHAVGHPPSPAAGPSRDAAPRDPSLLLAATDSGDPVIRRRATRAFRFDVAGGRLVVRGAPYDFITEEALRRRLDVIAGDSITEPHRTIADTVSGADRLFWLWIDRGPPPMRQNARARFVYGIETAPAVLGEMLGRLLRDQPILPAALLGPPYGPDALGVAVYAPDGRPLWSNGATAQLAAPGVDTLPAYFGGAIVRVHSGPRLASVLRIGQPSPLYLPMLVALLILSLGLGAIALIQFRRMREMAELRERFIANVSHELRTPLTQMSMFAEMLEQSRVRSDEEARHYASVIRRETQRMTTLVESVLRFSRGQRPDILRQEARDLGAELTDAVAFFAPLAEARNVRVAVESSRPALVRVDPSGLRQVLLNLLDNAVKYGPTGQRITIRLSDADGVATVTVTDEGPGISPADRQRVFDSYVRLESAAGSRVAGAGIGLAVVRDLVEAHGGRVWVADAVRGAAIAFTLPLVAPTDTDAPVAASALAGR